MDCAVPTGLCAGQFVLLLIDFQQESERVVVITINFNDVTMQFYTDDRVFSPRGLDAGTRAMLSQISFSPDDKVLDLGCGYGVVGIYAARQIGASRVVMVDVDPIAVALAKENAVFNGVPDIAIQLSDGLRDLDDAGFTKIISNPPYHTDFSVAKHFIEKGFNRLKLGGEFYMVTKRREWYKQKFIAVFGGVNIIDLDGYVVFRAEKRSASYAKKRR